MTTFSRRGFMGMAGAAPVGLIPGAASAPSPKPTDEMIAVVADLRKWDLPMVQWFSAFRRYIELVHPNAIRPQGKSE